MISGIHIRGIPLISFFTISYLSENILTKVKNMRTFSVENFFLWNQID